MTDKSVVIPSGYIGWVDSDPREESENIDLYEADVPESAFQMLLLFARRVLFIDTTKGVYIGVRRSTLGTGATLHLRQGNLIFSEEPYEFHWVVDPEIIPADRSVILQIAESCEAKNKNKEKTDGRE